MKRLSLVRLESKRVCSTAGANPHCFLDSILENESRIESDDLDDLVLYSRVRCCRYQNICVVSLTSPKPSVTLIPACISSAPDCEEMTTSVSVPMVSKLRG